MSDAAPLDVRWCRSQFPGLSRLHGDAPVIFYDGPAGSQVPHRVIGAMSDYLANTNANHSGAFASSRESDAIVAEAHRALADFVGASDPDCIIFGPNMTTLTLHLSRSLAKTWVPGDEVLVTQLDHDANYAPWMLAARDAGAELKVVRIDPRDCSLDLDDLQAKLSPRTKLLAFSCASNAVGNVTPIADIIRMAHETGAMVFLDAVHYAAHLPIDVAAWNCDFLACSPYKFFGPHQGVLYGKREHLESLEAYKVRPAPNDLPGKWMTGTQSHESIAGSMAAVDYLASIGARHHEGATNRRAELLAGLACIRKHEHALAEAMMDVLDSIESLRVWGITDRARFDRRVSTFSVTHESLSPKQLAGRLGAEGVCTWSGNYYALPLTEALNLEPEGMLRIGLLHYNTAEEIERFAGILRNVCE